jgi:hypothetical protein
LTGLAILSKCYHQTDENVWTIHWILLPVDVWLLEVPHSFSGIIGLIKTYRHWNR